MSGLSCLIALQGFVRQARLHNDEGRRNAADRPEFFAQLQAIGVEAQAGFFLECNSKLVQLISLIGVEGHPAVLPRPQDVSYLQRRRSRDSRAPGTTGPQLQALRLYCLGRSPGQDQARDGALRR